MFLGGEGRNYFGIFVPDRLNKIWKYYLEKGKTTISRNRGVDRMGWRKLDGTAITSSKK